MFVCKIGSTYVKVYKCSTFIQFYIHYTSETLTVKEGNCECLWPLFLIQVILLMNLRIQFKRGLVCLFLKNTNCFHVYAFKKSNRCKFCKCQNLAYFFY